MELPSRALVDIVAVTGRQSVYGALVLGTGLLVLVISQGTLAIAVIAAPHLLSLWRLLQLQAQG